MTQSLANTAALSPLVFETIASRRHGDHVLIVTLNRPDVANAMNTTMGYELVALFEGFSLEDNDVRCIVLTGAGDKVFCAGGDLKERKGMSDEAWHAQHLIFERMVRAVLNCPIPIIAAVFGAAYAGGCEIACASDFIYADSNARFALTEVTLGIMPGSGGTQTLSRAVGERRAKEIILTGQPFSAMQARDWGLVNAVSEPGHVLEDALIVATKIAGNAPVSVRQAKNAIHRGLQMSLRDGVAFEIEAYNRTIPTQDRREGILAFNEKRKPVFKGR
jgi:enoyl-CoA hydratase